MFFQNLTCFSRFGWLYTCWSLPFLLCCTLCSRWTSSWVCKHSLKTRSNEFNQIVIVWTTKRFSDGSWLCKRSWAKTSIMKISKVISGKHWRVDELFQGTDWFYCRWEIGFTTFSFSYGHGVLRNPDPRFTALQEFCESQPELQNSRIIQLVKKVGPFKVHLF